MTNEQKGVAVTSRFQYINGALDHLQVTQAQST